MSSLNLDCLDTQQKQTYWTGVLAKNDVALEMALRLLLREVSAASPFEPIAGEQRDFDRLRGQVIDAVGACSWLPKEGADPILAMLGELAQVHAYRVTAMHDLWSHIEGTEVFTVPAYQTAPKRKKPIPSDRSLRDLRAMADEQMKVHTRIGFATQFLSEIRQGRDAREARLAYFVEGAMGLFDVAWAEDDGRMLVTFRNVEVARAFWSPPA